MNQHLVPDSPAELATLRQRLDTLEAEHRELQRKLSQRPVASRKFILSSLLVALTTAAGVLWGQEAIKAISVDSNGNVSIARTLTVAGPSQFSNQIATVGVGVPARTDAGRQVALDVNFPDDKGFHGLRIGTSQHNFWLTDSNDLIVMTSGNTRPLMLQDAPQGNVGIGSANPTAKLQVGDSGTTSFNNRAALGVFQRSGDEEGLSVRGDSQAVLQFCTSTSKECRYIWMDDKGLHVNLIGTPEEKTVPSKKP